MRFPSRCPVHVLLGTAILLAITFAGTGAADAANEIDGVISTELQATPVIGVDPSSLDFGCVDVGSCSDLTIDIFNDVADPASSLNVTNLQMSGAGFSLVSPPTPPFQIPGDNSVVTLTVRFCPVGSGAAAGSLTISSDNALNTPIVVNLGGRGNNPPTCDAGGPYAGNVGDPINFDGSASSDSDGSIVSYAWDFGDGGADTGAMVSHSYGGENTFTVTLTVTDDCASQSSCSVNAVISQPDALTPIIGVDPAALDFGLCNLVGTPVDLIVVLSNAAADPLSLLEIVSLDLVGANPGDFSLPSPPGLPLLIPGDGTTVPVTVRFTPTAAGPRSASLAVAASNAITSPVLVALSGEGNTGPTCDAGGPYAGNVGDSIGFDGSASSDNGTITSYAWDFGDGNNGAGATPSHSYVAGGVFTVTLVVTDDCGETSECSTTADINAPPSCDAGAPQAGDTGDTINFDGSASSDPDGTILSYAWDFGDGNNGTGATPSNVYADNGLYTVTLCVIDDDGAESCCTTTADITNRAPVCDAGAPQAGNVGDTINFDGSASSDPDGTIVSYAWDFGDGNNGTGATPSNVYASGGVFTVTLCVTDDDGAESCCTTSADINAPPSCDAGGPYVGETGDTINFDGSASSDPDGTITYAWDFGDGNNGTGATPSNVYADNGLYTVTLCVTDDDGSESCCSTTADIANRGPVCDAGAPQAGNVGDTINFDGSASSDPDGTIVSYAWDFGDANNGTGATPSNVYASGGVFTVTLCVTDDDGAESCCTTSADINAPPSCDAGGPYVGETGDTINFDGSASSDSDGTITYAWDFGDGNNGTGATPSNVYADNGLYTVTLCVTDDDGSESCCSTTADIANRGPVCDAGAPQAGNVGDTINFDGSASSDPDGTIVSYAWDFGDGNNGTGATPSNVYASGGVFTVTLCVTDDDGAESCCTTSADINAPPSCDAGGPYVGETGDTINFDGSASSDSDGTITYAWDFGDGNNGTGATPSNVYADNGLYTVTLCVTDDDGSETCCSTTADIANRGPVCDAGAPQAGDTGDTINFDGSASSDPDGTIVSYAWDFGDGNNGTGATPSNVYADNGLYTVTLCVTDDDGSESCCTTTADIANRGPVCDAGAPQAGNVGDTINFDGSASSDPDGTIVSYAWDFGDANNGTGATPSNVYASGGVFTVTLCVTDDDGAESCCTTSADINAPPSCDAGGPYVGETGDTINFDGSASSDSDGTITYAWDFGDGNNGTGATPSNVYADNGLYTVTLCVTDDDGSESCCTTTADIANRGPVCDAGAPQAGDTGDTINFDGSASSDPDGTIVSYTWDFGDGNNGTGATPSNVYADNGLYTVTLCVTDDDGAESCCTTTADIANRGPICDAGTGQAGMVGDTLNFDGSASSDPDGSIVSYAWDFGDGGNGTGAMVSHMYNATGLFTVTLCVTDDDGAESCCTTTANIGAQPEPPLCDAGGPYSGNEGDSIAFDGSASSDPDGTVDTYAWDFGDGNNGSGATPSNTYATGGLYTVTLCVTDNDGQETCCTTEADINAAPNCDAGAPQAGDTGDTINFDGSASSDPDGTIVSYAWDFGDGNNGTGATPSNVYADNGLYTVTLCVTDDDGSESCCSTTADIANRGPVCDAGAPQAGDTGDTINFDGSASSDPDGTIVSYTWDFGDGNNGTGATPSNVYADNGLYTVTLCVTDDDGSESCCSTTADIANRGPVCDAGAPQAGNVGDTINFDGSASSDPDGTITYAWDFGDGNNGTGATPSNVYASDGVFTVTLCVTDDDGVESCCETTATISSDGPPLCDANGPYGGATGDSIPFDGSGSSDDGSIVSYDWDFGDGNNGTGATPSHTYTDNGTYTVTLCVTDDGGQQSCCETTAEITNRGPICDANGPYNGMTNEVINFDGTGSSDPDGTIVSYSWDFGDGNGGAGSTPTHSYVLEGDYTVTLCVVDDDGETSCCSTLVIILDPVAVEMSRMDVTSHDGLVTLTWETSFEQSNQGFNIYRAHDGSQSFDKLTDELISGADRASSYEFVDETANEGQVYVYQLEAIDRRGGAQMFEFQAVTVARVLPKQMVLHQNRPNPFNPATTITFELSEPTAVSLRIYDMTGRVVRTLLSGEVLPQEFHSREWDGRDDTGQQVGSGMYIYRLQAGSTVMTRKMVLMK